MEVWGWEKTYDEEVSKSEGDGAERPPEEEDFSAEVGVAFVGAHEVGRDD